MGVPGPILPPLGAGLGAPPGADILVRFSLHDKFAVTIYICLVLINKDKVNKGKQILDKDGVVIASK